MNKGVTIAMSKPVIILDLNQPFQVKGFSIITQVIIVMHAL